MAGLTREVRGRAERYRETPSFQEAPLTTYSILEDVDAPAAHTLKSTPPGYGSLVGDSFTPEKHGSRKVRGQSVDITTKGPDHSVEVWANFVPNMAERVGFEPTMKLPPYRFSSSTLVVLPCHTASHLVLFGS